MTDIEKLQIYRKNKEGKGYKKIAAELNIPVSRVTAYLQRHKEEPILHCECCGKEFMPLPGRITKRFCSDACRKKAWRERKKKDPSFYMEFVCEECGRKFKAPKYKRARFCSKECFQENESRRWRIENGK